MENLPHQSMYVDPKGASSSNAAPQNAPGTESSFSETDRAEIQNLIDLLNNPPTRFEAVVQLNKVYKMNKDKIQELGMLLWKSNNTTYSLLHLKMSIKRDMEFPQKKLILPHKEVMVAYRLLSPPMLSMPEATRVCNALLLIQCMASHPEARLDLITAQIPIYIYPFLNTGEQRLVQYDYLRVSSLGVIGALLKDDCPKSAEIVHYLIQSEMVPLSLRCMDMGGNLAKSVATLVLAKILYQPEAKTYFGLFAERFFSVSRSLCKMVDEFSGKPPPTLLKNILICYLRLSEIARCCEALRIRYPQRLRNPAYLNNICDGNNRVLAERVLQNIMGGEQHQPQVVPAETLVSKMHNMQV